MYDFHCHTTMSDGELLPTELIRRMAVLGYTEMAISDHADFSNVEELIRAEEAVKRSAELYGIRLYSGIEITHVPPDQIDELAEYAKGLGAEVVVVHGETIAEPVAPGTNAAAISSAYVDVLAHPGLITDEDARLAARNGVFLEVTSRGGHNRTNGHVLSAARRAGAEVVVESDAHGPGDLLSERMRYLVARGAGMSEEEAKRVLSQSYDSLFSS
ncbi:MAG: histidinol phosphate phosphatase domain-containing protein [Methanocorpusculum sp.]|uniref:Histidinol phosphate phosphatase domain-containing protein n=1 Tax=Methanocorpusculum petauri TaxID=3002863 RepID=A0ABT4IH94_9EURY|nr:histidinol phosphate phosphatase domain-containing protein [Methanocorpusculum petauri]MCZ9313712.1 histidinol phosphate phosphatase domain-containing protein [Methanocorpusculum sp.]MCZ0860926.1 histidinol phosphate phosphatase domain-containing protein [Methanocorpusculum petauri]MDE2443185.1 histidinol phosphate phosphatase domain-containing protein [Methanocorpusculum sp.]MDE2518027.1 histidinol phosphate phosphatase domain-containing protein [Methanocorpusculum sp.]MDE2523060.1 histidi